MNYLNFSFPISSSSLSKMLLPGLASAITGVFTYYTLKIYFIRRRYRHIPGPPTKGILGFYFGHVYELKKNLEKKRVNADLYLDWIKEYGSTIKVQFGSIFIVMTVDQKAIREIIIERDYPKHDVYHHLGYVYGERFFGRGLATETDQKRWKHRRALFNPAFHKQVIANFLQEFNYKGDQLLEKIRKLADGKTIVTLMDEFGRTALDVISHVALGMNTDSLNDPNEKLNKNLEECFKGYQIFVEGAYFFLNRITPKYLQNKPYCRTVIKKLRKMGYDQIMNRIKLIKEESYVPNDLLSIVLKESEDEQLDIDDMIDEFITFFGAGQETTANTLSFCFIEIAKNPSIAEKLRDEIDSVLGDRNEITNEDLNNLNYVSCVIKETLRLWPPAQGTIRVVDSNDFKINGIHIPKNTFIHLNPYLCGKQAESFPDPLEFKPERFMTKNDSITAYNYFPFSLGPRNCIGQNFAKIEMKIILTKLIKNFDFRLKENQHLGPVEYTTYRPLEGAQCYITTRSSSN